MQNDNVIFLITSKRFDKDLMRMTLERLTKCKVFDFFSFDEASLYTKLAPKSIVYCSDTHRDIMQFKYHKKVDFIDISTKINQEGKNILRKHTTLADKIDSLLNNNLN